MNYTGLKIDAELETIKEYKKALKKFREIKTNKRILIERIKQYNDTSKNKYFIHYSSEMKHGFFAINEYSDDETIIKHSYFEIYIMREIALSHHQYIPRGVRLGKIDVFKAYILNMDPDKIINELCEIAELSERYEKTFKKCIFEVYRNFNYLYVDEEKLNEIFTGNSYTIDLGYCYVKYINRLNLPKVKFVSEVEE